MSVDDEMTIDERFKYLRKMKKRYVHAGRKERGHLLNEMEAVTGLHRKSLIRLINGRLKRKPRRRQRGRTYGPEVDDALRVIAESMDFICAERLTPNLARLAKCLADHGELTASPQLLAQLERISVSTVERTLARIRQDVRRLPRKGPRPANRATRDIPMRRISWDEQQPGHFEADLVHHCGPSASGEYVSTVQLVDVATGWSERVAVLGRSYLVMKDAFQQILARLPFPILEIHPDNGSEFFNHHMLRFWSEAIPGVQLSRSRPYHKRDNRFVEQKNSSLVRGYLGHHRLDSVTQTVAVNRLYNMMWIYYNFFQPVMRLTEKRWPQKDEEASRVKRRYDQARTPFDRLCATDAISQEQKEQLQAFRDQVNPRQLRREIHDLIDCIFSLPGAVPGTTESVRRTLTSHAGTGQDQLSLISTYMEQKPKTPERKERTSPVTLSFDRTIPVR
jgi:hypothetical protein